MESIQFAGTTMEATGLPAFTRTVSCEDKQKGKQKLKNNNNFTAVLLFIAFVIFATMFEFKWINCMYKFRELNLSEIILHYFLFDVCPQISPMMICDRGGYDFHGASKTFNDSAAVAW